MKYRVLRNPNYTAPDFAVAKRYSDASAAILDMGAGIVVDESGRLVAFHERHLPLLQRRAGVIGA